MLQCWWGGGGGPVAGRDDGGSRCAVALFGLLWHCQGAKVVGGCGPVGVLAGWQWWWWGSVSRRKSVRISGGRDAELSEWW